jgi:hypothetical protein
VAREVAICNEIRDRDLLEMRPAAIGRPMRAAGTIRL